MRRHLSADDSPGAASGNVDVDVDAFDEDRSSEMFMRRNQLHRGRRKTQQSQSVDGADTTGASSGPDSDSSGSVIKSVWKKAIRKLRLRRSRSSDDSKSSADSSNTNAEAAGEVDPVYSFLKLTSVIPREGTSVFPDDGHYCCSKTDQDIGVGNDDRAAGDPSRCQCPCHLPERLQSVHIAWIRSFSLKKT